MAQALLPAEELRFPILTGRFEHFTQGLRVALRVACHPLLVVASYLALALVMTWPLAIHLGAAAPGIGEATPLFLWNIWWIQHALLDGAGPLYRTDFLFHPQGTDLFLHGLTTLPSLLVMPVAAIFSPVTALGVLALLNCTLNAAATYRLVYRLTRHPLASWTAGVLFAFSPWAVGELQHHCNLYSLWPFILFMDLFLQVLESPNRKTGVQLGIAATVMVYTDLQFPVLALGPAAIVSWLWVIRQRRDRVALWKCLQAGLLALVLAVTLSCPFLYGVLREMNGVVQRAPADQVREAIWYSADVADFLQPDPLRWGGRPVFAASSGWHDPHGSPSQIVQLGYLPLALAAAGAILGLTRRVTLRSRFGARWWLGLGVLGVVLTLGPQLVAQGRPLELRGIPVISPLGLLMAGIPGFNIERVPTRHMVTVTLTIAVLGGLAIKWMLLRGRRGQIAAGLVLVAAVWELLPGPLQLDQFSPNPAYASLLGNGAVIDVPFSAQAGFGGIGIYHNAILSLGEQTQHGHPIVGGYVSRTVDATLAPVTEDPFLRYLAGCEHTPPSMEAIRRSLTATGAAYVILHRDWPVDSPAADGCKDRPTVEELRMFLEASGFEVLADTSEVVIYTPHDTFPMEVGLAGT